MKKIFCSLICLSLFSSCFLKQKETVLVSNPNDGGGMDSSGGEVFKSSVGQVEGVIEKVQYNSAEVLFRLALEYMFVSQSNIDKLYGEFAYQSLQGLFKAPKFDAQELLSKLYNNQINLNIKQDYCESSSGHKDGSAKGEYPNGEICLSIRGLRQVPPSSLRVQASALFIHELAHLFNLGEKEAQKIQNIIIDGRRYLLPEKIEKLELLKYSEKLAHYFNERPSLFYDLKSELIVCQNINLVVSLSDRLDALAVSSLDFNLNRRLPEYITLDISTLANMMKGLRGYCKMSPLSSAGHYNVVPNDKNDLKFKVLKVKEIALTTQKRLASFLYPLSDIAHVKRQLETFGQYVKLPDDPRPDPTFNYPKQCLLMDLPKNVSYFKPKKGPILKGGTKYCSIGKIDGTYDYYTIPLYWVPGRKLPLSVRRRIENIFKDKLIELKIRGSLGHILKHLLAFTSFDMSPKIKTLLNGLAFISNESGPQAPLLLKRVIIEAMMELQGRYENASGDESLGALAVIYYGLTKAKQYKLLDSTVDIDQSATQLLKTIQLDKTYKTRYYLFENELNKLKLPLFIEK